jgi:hypothetical protein
MPGSKIIHFFKIYFVFELAYINNVRGFHCNNAIHAYSVCMYTLYYISIPPFLCDPFSNSLVGFIMIYMI